MKIRRTCREVTQLVLQSQDRALTPIERWSLRLHWLACDGCNRFRRQAQLIQLAMDRWRDKANDDA